MRSDPAIRQRLAAGLRYLWLLTVVLFLVWYGTRNWPELRSYGEQLGWLPLLGAFGVLTAARLVLASISRVGVQVRHQSITLGQSLAINSAAQLGKYLPGGFWHFVGRAGLYRKRGIGTRDAGTVILLEHGVLVISGAWLGLLAALALAFRSPQLSGLSLPASASIALTSILFSYASLLIADRWWSARLGSQRTVPVRRLTALTFLFWSCTGIAFWLVIPSGQRTIGLVVVATAVFAAGWTAGSLMPFAPGGIGVREAVIVALLGPYVGTTTAVGAAAASRVIWTINELALALPSTAYLSSQRSSNDEHGEGAPGEPEADADRPDRPSYLD